jgi:hypothetical protein
MARRGEAVVDRSPLVGRGVAALVVTEQEMCEHEVAALADYRDLLM